MYFTKRDLEESAAEAENALSVLEHPPKRRKEVAEFNCHWDGCDRSFTRSVDLSRHLLQHNGELAFICPTCNKSFPTASAANAHGRIHTGDRRYPCSNCPKAFYTSGDRTKHMRTHTGDKPYVCPVPECGRAFSRSTHLTRHQFVHTGERPFTCEVCQSTFARHDKLIDHQQRRHKLDKQRSPSPGAISAE
jgi:KRAB domain-containing zinc finger protein